MPSPLAAAPETSNLGGDTMAALGVGGLGLILLAVLVMLVKKGGNPKIQGKFKGLHAVGLAYVAEVLLGAAGGVWDWPGTLLHHLLAAITTNPRIHIGIAVVAAVILGFIVFRNHTTKRGAYAGLIAAVAFRMAGGLFAYPAVFVASAVAAAGVR